MARTHPVRGQGLGLRRSLLDPLEAESPTQVDFIEFAPENWLHAGPRLERRLGAITERYPAVCHGLSLNLGGRDPLDIEHVRRVGQLLEHHAVRCYSEHLSFCADDGQLYELLPIPFTAEAVAHVAARIRQVQDILRRRIAIENVSYYCVPGAEMREDEFLSAVLAEADCDLLLDINNVYVNSVNHRYDAREFLAGLPGARIAYAHIAGHERVAPTLIIDTHGAAVVEPVWTLLAAAYATHGVFPTLLERDFDLPPLAELLDEMSRIRRCQTGANAALVSAQCADVCA